MIYYQKLSKTDAFREVYSFSNIPHLHEEIEIVYIKDGETNLSIDELDLNIKPNSLVVIFPNQQHIYNDNLNNANGYMMHIHKEYLKSPKDKSHILINDLTENTVNILEKLESNYQDDSKNILDDLFNEICPNLHFKSDYSDDLTTTQMILKYCFNNFKEPLTLDRLSKDLSINKFYISHIFNSKLKIGFNDYISRLRVEYAKKLLCCTNISITNIAYDVGFSTIRSFNRRFREFTNMAPKDFREKFSNI